MDISTSRRDFFKKSGALATGIACTSFLPSACAQPYQSGDSMYLIGPKEGYAPHVGALLSTMTMMRAWVVGQVEGLSVSQLDFQIDEQSNSIGAMLYHLAATERYYQLNTFDNMEWGTWDDEIKEKWDVPMGLGEKGRKEIKGKELSFYLGKLKEVREVTKREFAKRDDDWLMKEVTEFFWRAPNQ